MTGRGATLGRGSAEGERGRSVIHVSSLRGVARRVGLAKAATSPTTFAVAADLARARRDAAKAVTLARAGLALDLGCTACLRALAAALDAQGDAAGAAVAADRALSGYAHVAPAAPVVAELGRMRSATPRAAPEKEARCRAEGGRHLRVTRRDAVAAERRAAARRRAGRADALPRGAAPRRASVQA
jgi:hypothetical protein